MTNVLIYVLDGLRADHVSANGYHRPATPNLDRLAADSLSLRLPHAFSPATLPAPAVASVLTGCYPSTHGLRGQDGELAPGVPQLPVLLQAAGYHTMGINAGAEPSPPGFSLGFDHFADLSSGGRSSQAASLADVRAERVDPVVWAWLDDLARTRSRADTGAPCSGQAHAAGRPWFLGLWAHGVREPFRPAPEFDLWGDRGSRRRLDGSFASLGRSANGAAIQGLMDLYDGAIAAADARLGLLLDRLVALGLYDDTLIIVTGTHGEAFGEHGDFGHGHLSYEEVMRVPMVVKFPIAAPICSGVNDSMMDLADVAPTVLDSLGLRPLALGMQGYSLIPVLRGRQPGRSVAYAETVIPEMGYRLLAVRADRWKYLRSDLPVPSGHGDQDVAQPVGWRQRLASTWRQVAGKDSVKQALRDPAAALRRRRIPREMLFDLQADPMERRNLLDQDQDVTHEMRAMLEAWLAECRVYADLNSQRMETSGQAGSKLGQPQDIGLPVAGEDGQRTT
ncbi:MAG: sulfatase [Anaerolineae bacterium]